MHLALVDWIIIAAFLLLSLFIGLRYRKRASRSLSDFFLGGRNFPWYIAGISMVATTFAADTPLAVTELVATHGISGNWLWWNFLAGGMLTTFFFARLWRRANILTEVELVEFRYSGIGATILRGFKSVYMGLFMNALIIGWVNLAMMSILRVFFEIPESHLLWYAAALMAVAAIYSALAGLWGVAITDLIQFVIAMAGCIILAVIVLNTEQIGGISGLKAQLPAWSLDFFPTIGSNADGASIGNALSIGIGAFLAYASVQWWASWYPGAEPGGGGYIAQRMMSAKDEKHALFATLFFQIAHYCLRPWPWIIVGLCTLLLYPDLPADDKKLGFVLAMKDYLPTGLKGLLLVAFLAAYMSTISTQLNWGASYLVNDLYKRFIKPENRFETPIQAQRNYVSAGRVATVFIMVISLAVTSQLTTISGVWAFIIECGAGLGLVLILRWYWWRINAWSEMAATITPFIAYAVSRFCLKLEFPESFFLTVGSTTLCWLAVTFLTRPVESAKLQEFYRKVRPGGWWKPVRKVILPEGTKPQTGNLAVCWLSSIAMTYSVLFSTGKFILQEWVSGAIWLAAGLVSFLVLRTFIYRTKVFED